MGLHSGSGQGFGKADFQAWWVGAIVAVGALALLTALLQQLSARVAKHAAWALKYLAVGVQHCRRQGS